jgi:Cu+-exporting ATPase
MAIYQFALHNVRCAGCVRSVEKSLNGTPEIQDFAINFADRTASVQTDADPAVVIKAVEAAGYGADLLQDQDDYDQRAGASGVQGYTAQKSGGAGRGWGVDAGHADRLDA